MSKAKRVNPVTLKAGMSIGTGNAESDDDLLFECFVTYPPVDEAPSRYVRCFLQMIGVKKTAASSVRKKANARTT